MRELCERPGSKFKSLPLSSNWDNAIVHAVFDGRLFPHSKGFFLCGLFCVNFNRYHCPGLCSRYSCICKSIFYCTVYFVGVVNSFEIMGNIYNIILVDLP